MLRKTQSHQPNSSNKLLTKKYWLMEMDLRIEQVHQQRIAELEVCAVDLAAQLGEAQWHPGMTRTAWI